MKKNLFKKFNNFLIYNIKRKIYYSFDYLKDICLQKSLIKKDETNKFSRKQLMKYYKQIKFIKFQLKL